MISICQSETGELERKYVLKAMEDGDYSGRAPTVKRFEEAFAKYIGTKYACAVPNGTIALHLGLRALGVGPGDEVILPSQTISSCLFAVHYLGAKAIIVDVDKDTWCIDPQKVYDAVSPKTKAIMPVHLYGLMSNVDKNWIIAQSHKGFGVQNISIIEDSAEAHASEINGQKAGSIGDVGCFSMFYNKLIQAGEFGVITTSSDAIIEKLRYFRDMGFGKTPETKFFANDLAYNYRVPGMSAALALAQLERIDYLLSRRLEIHSWYEKYLSPKFIWQKVPVGYKNSYWMEAVIVPKTEHGWNKVTSQGNGRLLYRNAFMQYMRDNGVETRPSFPPLGSHSYIQKEPYKSLTKIVGGETYSQYIWENAVLLPSGGSTLTELVIEDVCNLANRFIGE